MKIFQITHYGSLTNYGALLQAYALQSALKELGHDVTLLRASFSFHNVLRKWYRKPLQVLKMLFMQLAEKRAEKKNPRHFAEFAEDCMTLSAEKYHTHKELLAARLEADAFVTGSDQVWSSKTPVPHYFLEFGPPEAIRFSYAASVGSKARFDAGYLAALKEKTANFSGISVRESKALEQCQAAGIDSAVLVPDPVLLFSADEWKKRLSLTAPDPDRKYCLIYTVGHKLIAIDQELREYCRKAGLQIIMIPAQYYAAVKMPDVQSIYPDIPGFLNLINNAELVVTDSFHGTVFSLLFNTPFIVIPKNDQDARFITLDEYFHISGAYFKSDLKAFLEFKVDFHSVNRKICELRETGWSFLRKMTEK